MELKILKVGNNQVNSVEQYIGKIKNIVVDIPNTVTLVSQPYMKIPITSATNKGESNTE